MYLDEMQPGDKTEILTSDPFRKSSSYETVVRVTKTRIFTDRSSYMKSTGLEYGYSNAIWPRRIVGRITP